jgi:hemerythrin-like domain-containing protein
MTLSRRYACISLAEKEGKMVEIIEILRQEHRNIEKLLSVLEQELSVFARGERPDYEVVGAIQ